MKKLNTIAMMAMMVIGLTTGLTACGDDEPPNNRLKAYAIFTLRN